MVDSMNDHKGVTPWNITNAYSVMEAQLTTTIPIGSDWLTSTTTLPINDNITAPNLELSFKNLIWIDYIGTIGSVLIGTTSTILHGFIVSVLSQDEDLNSIFAFQLNLATINLLDGVFGFQGK